MRRLIVLALVALTCVGASPAPVAQVGATSIEVLTIKP
jgi:hypothetical protein